MQADEEPQTALEAAAASLDSQEGPKSFTDFLKAVLHPRSVVQVPLLGSSIRAPTGFGGITSHADIASQVCHQQLHYSSTGSKTILVLQQDIMRGSTCLAGCEPDTHADTGGG